MTEVARFFDAQSYSEGDQAEVQARFRSTGVLIDVASRLVVSAPGGMFVSIAPGEAMVEGFWYKNTAALQLPITNNSSGSTRYDYIVLRLNRTGNTLNAVVLVGTPGSGVTQPLTQIVGGTWELPLAIVTVPTGTGAIVPNMIDNTPPFTNTLSGTRPNLFDNPTFRVNQRNLPSVSATGYVADRWIVGLTNTSGAFACQLINTFPPNMGYFTSEPSKGLYTVRVGATAIAADTLVGPQQTVEGTKFMPLMGQTACVSWWSYSNKVGTYSFNYEPAGTTYRYLSSWTHGLANAWQFNYVVIPWNGTPPWVTTTAGALTCRWVVASGDNYRHTVTNQWINANAKYIGPDHDNPLTAVSDIMWIYQPKLEAGTYPTRFEAPDPMLELLQCHRQLYVEREQVHGWIGVSASAIIGIMQFPTEMRAAPSLLLNQAPTMSNAAAPTANQLGVLAHSSWLASMTYASWALWVTNGKRSLSTYLALSTGPGGVAPGDSALIVLGSNMQAIFSSEL